MKRALLFAAAVAAASAQAQPKLEGYLCCNMRSDGRWISDSNYLESGKFVVPLGTPARVLGYARYRVQIQLGDPSGSHSGGANPGSPQTLGNDYSRNLTMADFAGRYIVAEDPNVRLRSFPRPVQDAILSARVSRGMTREQVLMALGYPMASETPQLDTPVWKYWLWTFSPYDIHFDDRGLVSEIFTDPQTRSQVVVD